MGRVVALEPTFAGRRGPKLQLMWQCVDACSTPCLDLELVCGGTRSSGCRQRPPGPPRERLRTRRWGQFFSAPLGYLKLFTRQSTVPPSGDAEAEGPEAPTIKAKKRVEPLGGVEARGLEVEDVNRGPPEGC
jgi:hypothetical protein